MPTIDDPISFIDPQTVSGRSAGMKWGLIGGVAHIFLDLVGYLTGALKTGDPLHSFILFAVAIGCVVMAIRQHKEELGGYIRGARCVNVGLWSGLVYGIIAGLWGLIFYNLLVPEFYEEMNNGLIVMYEEMGQSDEQIETIMGFAKITQTPIGGVISSLITGVLAGVILSIIPALIMKKKPEGIF